MFNFLEHLPKFQPQPTKLTPSSKTAPSVSQNLKPVQAELGRSATFTITYAGDEPVNVNWFHNGKQIRSAFDTQVFLFIRAKIKMLEKLLQIRKTIE